jgi:hypothetical protein
MIRKFLKVLALAKKEDPDFPLIQSLTGGLIGISNPVDWKTYQKRREICRTCPVFDPINLRCWNDRAGVGCKCFVPLKAWVQDACFGYVFLGDGIGWSGKVFEDQNRAV